MKNHGFPRPLRALLELDIFSTVEDHRIWTALRLSGRSDSTQNALLNYLYNGNHVRFFCAARSARVYAVTDAWAEEVWNKHEENLEVTDSADSAHGDYSRKQVQKTA